MATGITIDEVTNTLDDIQGTEKIPVSSGISEPEVVTTGDLKDYINDGMQEEISDLSTIRSGASAGATAYQKPSSGIPSTDLASAVQTSLGKADTALQSFTETDPTVPSWAKQSSKPSYAVGEISGAQETLVSGTNIKTINGNSVLGSGNISIQGGDANVIESISFNGSSVPVDSNKNAAITYTAPVTSVNGNTGAVVISVPTKVSDLTNDSGYITSYTETDPVFSASAAHSITSADIAVWNTRKAQSIPFGHVDSSSIATAFTATVDGISALEDGVCCYLNNTVITSAASTTTPKCWTLNINNLGAKPVYVTTAAATFSTTQFTLNYKFLFTYDSSLNNGEGGWYIGLLYNTNTTYSTITQAEIDAGTGTKARNITPKLLRDNFYTENEVDGLLADKADSADLASVATSGSYNDLDNKPTIPDISNCIQKSSTSGLVKNDGTIDTNSYITSAHEVPGGGNAGQVLKKTTGTDYDYAWSSITETYPSAYCSTAGGTALKVANCTLWVATANTYLHILMGVPNTYQGELKLKVNSNPSASGATIYINGVVSSSTNYTLPAGSYIIFYDGTYFHFRTDGKIQAPNGTLVQTNSTAGLLKNDGTVDTTSYGTYSKPSGGIPASDIASGVIPTVPTISTDISSDAASDTKTTSPKAVKTFVEGKGYTTNTGTITGVTMNGTSKGTSGVVDLGTVITAHQDISGKENTSNKVTSLSSASTDTQYPSAKCVWDLVGDIETLLAAI